jgi:hypothetical protein
VRILAVVLGFWALFVTGSAASAEDVPALNDAKALCIDTNSTASKAIAAADAAGWTIPQDQGPQFVRENTVAGDTHYLVIKHSSQKLADGGVMLIDYCAIEASLIVGDPREAAEALVGGREPIIDSDNSWQWLYHLRDGHFDFLPDKAMATITAALEAGPVMELAAGAGSGGTIIVYISIHKAAP